MSEGKKVIVFRETTGEARGCAEYLAAALGLPPVGEALAGLPSGDPSRASRALRECLSGGVAFHHSHLSPGERRVVEDQFRKRDGGLRVLAATTTLAMGVNTPAEAVVIVGLNHPGGKPYSVAEYKNLAGRAGRLGFSEHGASYLLATDSRQEHDLWTRYVAATPEDLASRFLDADPGTMVVRVLAATRRRSRKTATGMTAEAIVDFLASSFGAFQLEAGRTGRWPWNRDRLLSELARLERHGLVQADAGGRYGLTPLGELAGETGLEVASVTRVSACLGRLHPDQVTDPTLLAVTQLTIELDQVGMPYNKKSVEPGHKEPVAWFGELRRQGIAETVLSALRSDLSKKGQDVMRAKKAVACLFYIQGADMLGIEAALTRFGGASGGVSGQVRQTASRACDVLPAVAKAAGLLHPGLRLDDRLERLLVRLELGVSGQVAELAVHARSRLDRDDYRRIAASGIMGAAPALGLPDADLAALVGGDPDKMSVVKDAFRRVAEARAGADATGAAILAPYVQ